MIQSLITTIVVSVAVMLVVFRAYPFLGEKLLGHFLDQRLQRERHEQNKQIEEIRAEFSHLGDRGKLSNEREYSALSSIWEKFVDLYVATRTCVAPVLQYPDLSNMSDEQVNEFLDTTDFTKGLKDDVRKAGDKNQSFAYIMRWRYIAKAQSEDYELTLLLHKLGIFIPKELKEQLTSGEEMCNKAIAQVYTERSFGYNPILKHAQVFVADGNAMLDALKDAVRARLLA